MSTSINVVRYHLVQRFNYLILPWAILIFVFGVDAAILAFTPAGHTSHRYVGGLASLFVMVFVLGIQSVARGLPFGLALGLSRRSYYLGTALLAVGLAAVAGVVTTVGQALERSTGGWGLNMGFFRVPYILDGSWYTTWLVSFVVLTLLFTTACGSVSSTAAGACSAWPPSWPARWPYCSLGPSPPPGPTPGTTSATSSPPSAPQAWPVSWPLSPWCSWPGASPPFAA